MPACSFIGGNNEKPQRQKAYLLTEKSFWSAIPKMDVLIAGTANLAGDIR